MFVSGALSRLDRRDVLKFGLGSLMAGAFGGAALATGPADPVDLTTLPGLPSGVSGKGADRNNYATIRGADEPTAEQKKMANAIAGSAPRSKNGSIVHPYEVALYFLSIVNDTSGNYDPNWPGYMRAWPRDAAANPLIRDVFFSATNLASNGDLTAWCSAFVNWCFKCAATPSLKPARTARANSSSWRDWGDGITFKRGDAVPIGGTPKVGDIVVFKDVKDPNYGHVAFFRALKGDRIQFFGGNHLEGRPVRHVISEKSLPLWGNVLEIHSIRKTFGPN